MSRFDYLLLDADNTVLDFSKSERIALSDLLSSQGLPITPEVIDTYSMLNEKLWRQLERGELKREELQRLRFEQLLTYLEREAPWHPEWDLTGFDWEQTDAAALNENFIDHLSRQTWLMTDADLILPQLRQRWELVIVTNGIQRAQQGRLAGSKVADCFSSVFVSETVGYDKPDPRYFDHVCAELGVQDRSRLLLIGDSPASDLLGGYNAGIPTCWYNPWARDLPHDMERRPDHEIRGWRELPQLLAVLDPPEE